MKDERLAVIKPLSKYRPGITGRNQIVGNPRHAGIVHDSEYPSFPSLDSIVWEGEARETMKEAEADAEAKAKEFEKKLEEAGIPLCGPWKKTD